MGAIEADAPERIRLSRAASILGGTQRTVQALAARGQIPGASKVGGLWYFDEAAFRQWIKDKERCPRDRRLLNTPTGEAASYGRASPLQERNSEKAWQQTLQKLRRG